MSYIPVEVVPGGWHEMHGCPIRNGDEFIAVVNEDWVEFIAEAVNEKIERESQRHCEELAEIESALGVKSEMGIVNGSVVSITRNQEGGKKF